MNIIEAKNITKTYKIKSSGAFKRNNTFDAVKNVDISLKQGKTLGVIGESGSGKSTLGEIIGNLQKPTKGNVFYKGKDITTFNKAEYKNYRKNVQYIFQNPKESMNPYYTVEHILEEPMKILCDEKSIKSSKTKICEMLEKVGIEKESLNKYSSEMSGGQCQRIAIARALLLSPEVIICDECVSALDVSVQAQILNLLKDLQKEFSTTYLFISHNMGVVHYISDDIIVVKSGNIIESGSKEEIIKNPQQIYTNQLIKSAFLGEEVCL